MVIVETFNVSQKYSEWDRTLGKDKHHIYNSFIIQDSATIKHYFIDKEIMDTYFAK